MAFGGPPINWFPSGTSAATNMITNTAPGTIYSGVTASTGAIYPCANSTSCSPQQATAMQQYANQQAMAQGQLGGQQMMANPVSAPNVVCPPMPVAPNDPDLGFNPFLNASDQLQKFIRDAGRAGARQSDVLSLPVELFINWLILKAAERDGSLPGRLLTPRCRWCGRFLAAARAQAGILFCGEAHAVSFMRRQALA